MLVDRSQDCPGRYISCIRATQIILLLVPPCVLKAQHLCNNSCDFARNVNQFLGFQQEAKPMSEHLSTNVLLSRSQNVNGIKYHAKNGHRTQIRVRKPFKCRCGKSYKTAQGLRHHTINFHPPVSAEIIRKMQQ